MVLLRTLLLLPLPLAATATHGTQPGNSIASFGWYWAMEDGGGNATAFNERNCSAPAPCSWDHANVQNSLEEPVAVATQRRIGLGRL